MYTWRLAITVKCELRGQDALAFSYARSSDTQSGGTSPSGHKAPGFSEPLRKTTPPHEDVVLGDRRRHRQPIRAVGVGGPGNFPPG